MQPSVSRTPYISSNMRYLGARLASGYTDVGLAADILGLEVDEYRSFEDIISPHLATKHHMARTFGVSVDFLTYGTTTNPREELAEIIAQGLSELENQRIYGSRSQGSSQTLIAMRKFARYRTPDSAAARMGLNPLLYLAHESGARAISIDVLIIYAILFNVRPDRALTNKPLARLWAPGEGGWWRSRSASSFAEAAAMVDHAFDWLPSDNCASATLVLPVVKFLDGKWQLTGERLQWPRSLLTVTNPIAGDTLYAIAGGHQQATWVTVVDPEKAGESSVLVDGSGHIFKAADVPATEIVDPVHHRPGRKDSKYCVGSWVARMTLN